MRSFKTFLRILSLLAVTSAAVWGLGCAQNSSAPSSGDGSGIDVGGGIGVDGNGSGSQAGSALQ